MRSIFSMAGSFGCQDTIVFELSGSQKDGFQKGGFGGCSPVPTWYYQEPEQGYMWDVPRYRQPKRGYIRMFPGYQKPERGLIRQKHPFTKPPFCSLLKLITYYKLEKNILL